MDKKILYGVQATGSGHFSRSIEVIKELRDRGAIVDILVSGDSYQKDFGTEIKYRFKGLTFDPNKELGIIELFKQNNIIDFFKTVRKIDLSEYDLVVTDFEPITSWAALFRNKKIVGIGNHYKFFEWTWKFELFFFLNKLTCHIISPVREYIGFDYLRSNKKIFNPIIRKDLKDKIGFDLGFYVSYLHNYTWEEQVEFYKQFETFNFVIYSNNVENTIFNENCVVRNLNTEDFKNDLMQCSGAICNAGFQTTSECLYLGKKIFVIPIKKQIEQRYNKNVLKNLGFYSDSEFKKESFEKFLNSCYYLKINYTDSMSKIIDKIDSML